MLDKKVILCMVIMIVLCAVIFWCDEHGNTVPELIAIVALIATERVMPETGEDL